MKENGCVDFESGYIVEWSEMKMSRLGFVV